MLQKSKFDMVFTIERICINPNYYSDWNIKVSGAKNFEVSIRSWPEETETSLWNKINSLNSISSTSVASLDKKSRITYD